ncbi:MAG: hypothetical protein Q8T11_09130 [Elusimicrobiota bacterium]|nr:hypothetical protein [Elusimicrobiota bacterium]
MKRIAPLAACCGLTLPNFPHASAAPAVAAAPAPAPAPAPEKVTVALEVKFDTAQAVVKPE